MSVPPLLPLITSGISDFEKIWGEDNKENIMAGRNEQQVFISLSFSIYIIV